MPESREMIVAAALPLVAEHGASVTTAQIAHAAGIGEDALSRLFPNLDELLAACATEAMLGGDTTARLPATEPNSSSSRAKPAW